MKKVIDSYNKGVNGVELDSQPKRRHRAAHRLGNIIRKSYEKEDRLQVESIRARLDKAIEVSQSGNKTALEIIKATSVLVHKGENDPAWSTGKLDKKHDFTAFNWLATFQHGPKQDHTRNFQFGLLDMPAFMLDGDEIPVDNLSISCEAPVNKGEVGAAKTTLHLNSRAYDPDAPFSDSTDSIRIDLDSEGGITISRSGKQSSGYNDINPADTGVNSFLEGVQTSLQTTIQAYQELGKVAEGGM